MSRKRVIDPGWPGTAGLTYSQAVVKGGLLFVSGLNSMDAEGRVQGETLAEQAEVIYRKLGQILAAAGAGFEDVVKTTDYVTDREGYRETAAVRARYLGPDFPAATGVVVKELFGRGVRIEIDAIAVLDDA
ncbi:MAG TPA: RidA family protein [Candidatus Dormibacteraeota bacterium]|jgi:2-iminobutanoate/2-iminopropanoate deaminase|nr:RidA family protein [Candidatus Dormibacteraeota bacterium]